jgi:hypothetical protein
MSTTLPPAGRSRFGLCISIAAEPRAQSIKYHPLPRLNRSSDIKESREQFAASCLISSQSEGSQQLHTGSTMSGVRTRSEQLRKCSTIELRPLVCGDDWTRTNNPSLRRRSKPILHTTPGESRSENEPLHVLLRQWRRVDSNHILGQPQDLPK